MSHGSQNHFISQLVAMATVKYISYAHHGTTSLQSAFIGHICNNLNLDISGTETALHL